MRTVTAPAPYDGPMTKREVRATHDFHSWDDEAAVCWNCDSKDGSMSAQWPCGTEIPRVTYEIHEGGSDE